MKILVDNGHGSNTPGKRSPDGRLLEYAYAREIAERVVRELCKRGLDAERIVREEIDVPLSERCNRANEYKANEAILVSIHCNAAGIGKTWMSAKGWSAFVSLNASDKSKKLANCLARQAAANKLYVRYQRPDAGYWQQDLAICRDTKCPAVLTENLFMDNKEDVDFLLSEAGKSAIVKLHVDGITDFLEKIK